MSNSGFGKVGGDSRRQGSQSVSQSQGPGLSQLISSRAGAANRPAAAADRQQSSCETAGGENVSLTLQIVAQRAYLMLPGPRPYLMWPPARDASSYTMFHLVESAQFGACVRVCRNLVIMLMLGLDVDQASVRSPPVVIECGGKKKGMRLYIKSATGICNHLKVPYYSNFPILAFHPALQRSGLAWLTIQKTLYISRKQRI